MIDPKKSKFRRQTIEYTKDSILEIIDIVEAIKKNKVITRCEPEKFIYKKYLNKQSNSKFNINLKDYYFEFDNGHIKYFTEYYDFIDVIGKGSYGLVISARDLLNKNNIVAIKVSLII